MTENQYRENNESERASERKNYLLLYPIARAHARTFNWWNPEYPPTRVSPIDGSVVPINPDVPLRERGVVEKCTFCAHRIRNGNPVPKCVEVCPVNARHFGDLNEPESEVSRLLRTVRTHRIKEELNTQPMIYYFTRGVKWNEDGEKLE